MHAVFIGVRHSYARGMYMRAVFIDTHSLIIAPRLDTACLALEFRGLRLVLGIAPRRGAHAGEGHVTERRAKDRHGRVLKPHSPQSDGATKGGFVFRQAVSV